MFIKKVKGGVGAVAQQVIGTGGDCEGEQQVVASSDGGGGVMWSDGR